MKKEKLEEALALAVPAPIPALAPVLVQAEPEPLEIDLQRTAVMVIDMQNAFVSKGGMFDLWGRDMSRWHKIIEPIKKITRAARVKGCKVIYTASVYSPDLHDSGGPNSPLWYKDRGLIEYRDGPSERRDKFLIRGTWGPEIIDELKPQGTDILIEKPKFSAFFGTNLDTILKTYNIKYLIFVGTSTNVCVEASIRSASYLEYFPILISDAVMSDGPPFVQEATLYTIKLVYGWVTTTENIVKAME